MVNVVLAFLSLCTFFNRDKFVVLKLNILIFSGSVMSGFQNYFGNQDGFWKPFVSKDQPKITLGLLAYILGIGASIWIAQGNIKHFKPLNVIKLNVMIPFML